jgi:hypothetical protein
MGWQVVERKQKQRQKTRKICGYVLLFQVVGCAKESSVQAVCLLDFCVDGKYLASVGFFVIPTLLRFFFMEVQVASSLATSGRGVSESDLKLLSFLMPSNRDGVVGPF